MATTTLQCSPLMVGRSWEVCCLGGTAMTPKYSSCGTGPVFANFPRSDSRGTFEKAFLNGGAVRKSLPKSSVLGRSVDLRQSRGSDGLSTSGLKCRTFPRAKPVQAVAVQATDMVGKMPVNLEMLETYEIEEKVRDYELDHYGVVNNAIYAKFCQHARTELLENIGFSPDGVTESGKAMAISDMTMKFISPLRSGDRYVVSSRVAGTTAVRLIFEDHIYRLPERELVMTAKSTVLVLDENSKPGRLPHEVKVKLVNGYLTNYQGKGKKMNGHINGFSKDGHISSSSTSGQDNGNSRNIEVNGSPRFGHVNGASSNGHVNGSPTEVYVNGCPTEVYVNGCPTELYVNGCPTEVYVNGSPTEVYVNGSSRTREVSLVAA